MSHFYAAVDLGAESGRVLVVRVGGDGGGKLELLEAHRFGNVPVMMAGTLHWNLPGLWQEILAGLGKARAITEGAGGQLAGVGVDTWGVDFVLLDGDGRLLGLPVHYRDARTAGGFGRAFGKASKDEIYGVTGIQFMELNTLYQLHALVERKDAALGAAEKLLFMPDLLHYLLSGSCAQELSIASTSQLLDARGRDWADGLMSKLGIPRRLFGKPVQPGHVHGPLREEVQKVTGLSERVRVIAPASHDTASAVLAVPAVDASGDWCYLSSGTWSLMGMEVDEPVISAETMELGLTNEAGAGGKIRLLKNIMGMWLVQECKRALAAGGRDYTYPQLAEMAAGAKPWASLIDPEYAPLGTPGDMPGKIGRYCQKTGQAEPQDTAALIRCCLDSLALTYARTLEGLRKVTGKQPRVIHIVGGGCNNALLNQLTADACGVPVLAGPAEATALGNGLMQAIAMGVLPDIAAARKMVAGAFVPVRYEPRQDAAVVEAKGRYAELVKRS